MAAPLYKELENNSSKNLELLSPQGGAVGGLGGWSCVCMCAGYPACPCRPAVPTLVLLRLFQDHVTQTLFSSDFQLGNTRWRPKGRRRVRLECLFLCSCLCAVVSCWLHSGTGGHGPCQEASLLGPQLFPASSSSSHPLPIQACSVTCLLPLPAQRRFPWLVPLNLPVPLTVLLTMLIFCCFHEKLA